MNTIILVLCIVDVVGLFCTAGLAGYWWGRAHLYDEEVKLIVDGYEYVIDAVPDIYRAYKEGQKKEE